MNRAQRRATERDIRRQIAKGAVDLSQQNVATIALGYNWNEKYGVSGFWHQSILRMLRGLSGRVAFRPIPVECGAGALAHGRNAIVQAFLRNEDEYLLFTDTDMMFEASDVELLLAADAAIAGALYFNAATGELPAATALVKGDDGAYAPLSLPELPFPPEREDNESEEDFALRAAAFAAAQAEALAPQTVAGVGLGLTLIKRQVVLDVVGVYERPFEFAGDDGEDLTFCLRAAEFGHETVVVPEARIGHLKVGIL